ncbi:MAG TPA: bifunctional DNA primase/polymerase [Streptosporangiaceae bacterium]|nr:bifunctional DNA primase/polymerase [Streptosporangiaceae bacterium]
MVDVMLRRARRRERTARERMAAAARRYAGLGWPVCQGAYPPRVLPGAAAVRACSCDRIGCPAPGAHPVSPAWQLQATADPLTVGRMWATTPEANVILVTGRVFDVLDVPMTAGLTALAEMERAGIRPGPVAILASPERRSAALSSPERRSMTLSSPGRRPTASTGDRALFFVATRGAPEIQDEWWSCHLDCVPDDDVAEAAGLRWHCRDSYVLAPPSRCGPGLTTRWIREPEGQPLPDAMRLLAHLADASADAAEEASR